MSLTALRAWNPSKMINWMDLHEFQIIFSQLYEVL